MGISSIPSPSEAVLTLLVVNTVHTISILKEIVWTVLRFLRIRTQVPSFDHHPEVLDSFPCETDRFHSRFKPFRFGSALGRRRPAERHSDCRVCLTRFDADSVVNRLACGHLFHRACLEKWLDYHHVTCPLCRTHLLLPADDPAAAAPASSPLFYELPRV